MKRVCYVVALIGLILGWSIVLGYGQSGSNNITDSLKKELARPNLPDTTYIKLLAQIGESTPVFRTSYWDTIVELSTEVLKNNTTAPSGSDPAVRSIKTVLSGALNNIGYIHESRGEFSIALDYYHKSILIDEEIGNKQGMAYSYNNIGVVYYKQGNISLALEYYRKSLDIRTTISDKPGLAESYNNIGSLYEGLGDIALALEYYHKSLKLDEELGNQWGMATAYNNIGLIHYKQGDNPLALQYYQKSLEIKEELSDKQGMATSYNNIGLIHYDQGAVSLALDCYNKSLKIRREISDKRGMATCYNNMGSIYRDRGELVLALKCFAKSMKIREELTDKAGIASSLANIGSLHLETGKVDSAKLAGEKGLEIARQLGFPEQIMLNASILSKVARQEGNLLEALEMYTLEMQYKDSMNNKETQKMAVLQQAKYEYEKQKAIDEARHLNDMELLAERENKQEIISYAAIGGMLLVAGFLLFVFNRLRITRRQKELIGKKNMIVQQQKKQVEDAHWLLARHHKEMQDSIRYAKRIQEAIMPSVSAIHKALRNSFVLYKPKDVVAGDFYWMEIPKKSSPPFSSPSRSTGQGGESVVYFAAADCTGHGVPGAMVSVICSNALSKALLEENITETGELLNRTRDLVVQQLAKSGEEVMDGMDISLCAVDFNNMTMQWSGANNPLWIAREGEIIEYKPDKQPVGAHDYPMPFTSHTIELQMKDTIYVFSDGYQDQFGGTHTHRGGKKFKTKQLKELLLSIQDKEMDQQKEVLEREFENWKGDLEQLDDVCMIGVRI